ncbi:MAG: hypothetical protein JXA45_00620 [Methanomassiliicoccales archaeon]|nr:hypothetical protein [Methanomassiliicoccales archaeon]
MKLDRKIVAIVAVAAVVVLITVAVLPGLLNSAEEDNELRIAISSDVNSWYLTAFPDGDARYVWAQVFETLIRLDTNLDMVPGLAESWYSPDNGLTWIFNLTQGVEFHDGSDFNASAVIFSYSDLLSAKQWGILSKINSTVALSDHTVQFNMKSAMALPYYLTHVAWPILSPNAANADGSWNGQVIGTGPFKLEEHVTDQEIRLVRNEGYWGEAPVLERVTFKVVKDATTRVMALKAGDVDMILKPSESDVDDLDDTDGIGVQTKLTTFTDFLQFNTKGDAHNLTTSPFQDLNVRKAVAYAIDTEALVEDLLYGYGEAARGRPYSPCMMFSDPGLPLYSADLDTSNWYMEQSGWEKEDDGYYYKNGTRFQATLMLSNEDAWGPRFNIMADAIQAMLGEAGMDIELVKVPTTTCNAKEASGDFSMIMRTGYFVWGAYPRHFLVHFQFNVYSHYANASYNALVTASDATNDLEVMEEKYLALQQAVIDGLPAFYLVHEYKIVAYRDWVKGYHMTAEDPWLNLNGVSVER